MKMQAADIQIVLAKSNHVEDCADSVGGSAIGRRYFADHNYTRRVIQAGIDKKEIYVGIDGRNSMRGFYWASATGMFCRFPYLRILAVKPSFRGTGVGKELLRHFEASGFSQAPKVFLAVSDFNAGAQRFYESNGYARVGIVPDLYKPGIAEILMVKSVT
jgi:GNAT superfamily N-acetyltransferase